MIGLLVFALALSAWVAWCFQQRSFPAVWWVARAWSGLDWAGMAVCAGSSLVCGGRSCGGVGVVGWL